jgi:hypothetical protein
LAIPCPTCKEKRAIIAPSNGAIASWKTKEARRKRKERKKYIGGASAISNLDLQPR